MHALFRILPSRFNIRVELRNHFTASYVFIKRVITGKIVQFLSLTFFIYIFINSIYISLGWKSMEYFSYKVLLKVLHILFSLFHVMSNLYNLTQEFAINDGRILILFENTEVTC